MNLKLLGGIGALVTLGGTYYYFSKWNLMKVTHAISKNEELKRSEGINSVYNKAISNGKKALISFPIRKNPNSKYFKDSEALAYGLVEDIHRSKEGNIYKIKVTSIGKLLPNGVQSNLEKNDKIIMPPIGKVFEIKDENLTSISEWG